MAELKPNRKGNYHHNGNPKHGLYFNEVSEVHRVVGDEVICILGKTAELNRGD